MPVLVFVYEDCGRWLLRNVGNGPALNIDVAVKFKHGDHEWELPTRIPPISRDGEFHLSWLGALNVAVLAAAYEDFLREGKSKRSSEYTVQSAYDLNRVVPKRELPRWDVNDTVPAWQRGANPYAETDGA